ncbi:MAG: DNA-processing protein DprA [Deltaproteobacteria bacterium]
MVPRSAPKLEVLEGAALPPALHELPKPPVRIFAHGSLPRGPCVGVVGSRDASPEALAFAWQFAFDLARSGIAVVSGGARGIDAAAHRGALAAGGVTVIVAPSSLELPYPEKHAELFAEIVAKGGCHLSPFATGTVASQPQFFLRNGVLVTLSHALVIVEARLRGGACNAARWARRLDRPCFVVPSAPWHVPGLGGLQELERGHARPIASPAPVLRLLQQRGLHAIELTSLPPARSEDDSAPRASARSEPVVSPAKSRPAKSPPGRSARATPAPPAAAAGNPIERAILEAIDRGVRFPGEIAQALSLGIGEVSHTVLLLTLRGLIQSESGVLSRVSR